MYLVQIYFFSRDLKEKSYNINISLRKKHARKKINKFEPLYNIGKEVHEFS